MQTESYRIEPSRTDCGLTEPLPRLIRFVEAWELPQLPARYGETTMSTLDPIQNLLKVNKEMYEQLGDLDKDRVLKTRHTITYGRLT
jgi:hypothetical protein